MLIENTFERTRAVAERGTEFSIPKVSPLRGDKEAEENKLSASEEEERKTQVSTAKSSGASQFKERLGGAPLGRASCGGRVVCDRWSP